MHRKKINYFKFSTFFLLIIIVLLLTFHFLTFRTNKEIKEHIFSHRGASGEEIEHTLAAYDLALIYGSKYIEQDLVTSKENTLFVSHDLNAKRLTNINKKFSDMTDDEIKHLHVKNKEAILSLQDVFNRYHGKTNFVIELKENSQQIAPFIKIIKKNNLADDVIVQSSSPETLVKLEETFPKMKKLLLVKNQENLEKGVQYKDVDIISANKTLLSKNNVALVHNANKEFNVWTVNDTEEIEKAISLDVDNYFTNFTSKALTIEKNQHKSIFSF
ncbi:MAG: glycerophosphodiester phosphodiesterase [Vagococcus sp.]|uniref:glycerophosphodiester phosphodiesterase n=1 Tax=Vagococcus sp. TaxID=1933889 RepID=UPI002FC84E0A